MIEMPSAARKPAAKIISQINGLTRAAKNRSRCSRKRSSSRQTMPLKARTIVQQVHAATSSSVSPPIKSRKAPPRSLAPVSATTSLVVASRHDRPAIEHEQVVVRLDLVEQMRGPQHADIVGARKLMDVVHDGRTGRHIEADGGLVEQQQLRAVQERAGDLDPSAVATIQRAHALVDALLHVESSERARHALIGILPLQAAQRREIAQILLDREVEVERRLLEHHAERLERLGCPIPRPSAPTISMRPVGASNSRVISEKSVVLPAPFGPEQRRHPAGEDLEAHIVESLFRLHTNRRRA